jgi:hypothetical protein
MRTPNPYISLVRLLSNILDAHTVAFFVADSKGQHLNLVAAESLSQHLKKTSSCRWRRAGYYLRSTNQAKASTWISWPCRISRPLYLFIVVPSLISNFGLVTASAGSMRISSVGDGELSDAGYKLSNNSLERT